MNNKDLQITRCDHIFGKGKNKGLACNKKCTKYKDISRCYRHSVKLVKNRERYAEQKDEYKVGGKYYKYISACKEAQHQQIKDKDIPFIPQEEDTIRFHEGVLYIERKSKIEIKLDELNEDSKEQLLKYLSN